MASVVNGAGIRGYNKNKRERGRERKERERERERKRERVTFPSSAVLLRKIIQKKNDV